MEWINVEDKPPEKGKLLLIRVTNSNAPAMALFMSDGSSGYWKVQPLFSKWYPATSCDITHWMLLPGPEGLSEQEERTIIYVSIHCDDRLNEALCEAVGQCLTPVRIRKVDGD